jgi:hypothetical protein
MSVRTHCCLLLLVEECLMFFAVVEEEGLFFLASSLEINSFKEEQRSGNFSALLLFF